MITKVITLNPKSKFTILNNYKRFDSPRDSSRKLYNTVTSKSTEVPNMIHISPDISAVFSTDIIALFLGPNNKWFNIQLKDGSVEPELTDYVSKILGKYKDFCTTF